MLITINSSDDLVCICRLSGALLYLDIINKDGQFDLIFCVNEIASAKGII